jgi:hypothetical protein
MTIQAHDLMPMFTASRADGRPVRYEDVWQRRNLLLVSLPGDDPGAAAYAESIGRFEPAVAAHDAVLIVTMTRIDGVPSPGVVVADRWGEVYYVQGAEHASDLPAPDELLAWLQFVQYQCPECQGETR